MHAVETVGAVALGGGFAGAAVAGFILYLAGHGVPPVPDPGWPEASLREDHEAFIERYNARFVSVTRVAFYLLAGVAVVGLILLVVGVVLS